MKRTFRILVALMTVLLLLPNTVMTARANSAEPPCFTILVSAPPEDLSLSLQLSDGAALTEPIQLTSYQKAWETYYRFFYHMAPDDSIYHQSEILTDAVLIVEWGENHFQCAVPSETFRTHNNLLTLDLKAETLTVGQPAYRVPLLTAMRILLTLLIEGVIFYLFGYRQKVSWILFLIVNLFTQISLNVTISGPLISAYWVIGFAFSEILILIGEAVVFCCFAKEHRRLRSFFYAIIANIASLILGGMLIAHLPV